MNPEVKKQSEVMEQVEMLDKSLGRLGELTDRAGNVFAMVLKPRETSAALTGKDISLSACELQAVLGRINAGFKDRLDNLESIVRSSAL